MTTIIGLEQGGDVWLGADTQTTNGWQKKTVASKLARVGGLLLGLSGQPRMMQVIRYIVDTPVASDEQDDMHYLVKVADCWRCALKDAGFSKITEAQEKTESEMLIAYRGKLYSLDVAFCVTRNISGYAAIGTGGEYALGAMMALSDIHQPEERIKRALDIAAKFDIGTSAPFEVVKL